MGKERICKYCGEPIAQSRLDAGLWLGQIRRQAEDRIGGRPGGASGMCPQGSWHAPWDVPSGLDEESLERWLAEPVVID